MKTTILILLALIMAVFFASCEAKPTEVIISSNIIKTDSVYKTIITESNGKTVVRGRLIEIRLWSGGENDLLVFEDGTIVPVIGAKDLIWRLKRVYFIELGSHFGYKQKTEIITAQVLN